MIKKKKIFAGCFWVCFTCLVFSCDNRKEAHPLHVIPVASAVGDYNILNLSEYATEIRYIPLETNDLALFGEIRFINYEDDKIFISDWKGGCHLFDNNGKFLCKIGQRGQGPDDYLYIFQSFMHDNLIYLNSINKLLIYNANGRLVENIKLNPIEELPTEYYGGYILPLNKDTFVMDANTSTNVYYPKAILFEKYQSKAKMIKLYKNDFKFKERTSIGLIERAIMYRFNNEVRTYKYPNCDTIFTIGQDLEMKDAFIFELGNYRPPLSFFEEDTDIYLNFIHPANIFESHNHIFIEFSFGKHAPEPFEYILIFGGSEVVGPRTNYNVLGVFDKRTGELKLMKQPVKGKLGFKNDIDNGPIIWPHYISPNNELVTYISVEDFMDYYEKIANPTPQMTEIAKSVNMDDNQIVIIAKLKE